MDDQGSPAVGLTAVKTLIGQDHVVALAGGLTDATQDAWATYVQSQHVPVIGGTGSSAIWSTNPVFISVGTTILGQLEGVVTAAKSDGATKVGAAYCAEAAECSAVIPLLQASATKAGLSFSGGLKVSASAPDYTAQCLAWKQAGDNYVFLGLASATILHVVQDCLAQGYKPTYGLIGSAIDTSLLTLKGATFLGVAPTFPWFVTTSATKDYQTAMARYAKGQDTSSLSSTQSWASLAALEAAIEKAHPAGDVTSEDVFSGLDSGIGTLNGLLVQAPPVSAGKPEGPVSCFFTIQVKNGAFEAPTGMTPTCPS
jgi:branched-chain amino acid transport system substrate-binding protein